MLKYYDYAVTFAEIPDEINLYITISNCPNDCKGCNSPWLKTDKGKYLDWPNLRELIDLNQGITCVVFGGGDSEPEQVNYLASKIREDYPDLKIAWYTGKEIIAEPIRMRNFDYIKTGPYIEEYGPLNSRDTNQRLYQIFPTKTCDWHGNMVWGLENITNKFWKNEDTRISTRHHIFLETSNNTKFREG